MYRKSVMLNAKDSVAMLLEDSKKGDWISTLNGPVELLEDMECSHKVLLVGLRKNDPIIKYGKEIGRMTCDAQNRFASCLRRLRLHSLPMRAKPETFDEIMAPPPCAAGFFVSLLRQAENGFAGVKKLTQQKQPSSTILDAFLAAVSPQA